MASGYINYDLIIAAARDSIRPRLLATTALTLTGSVMIAGLCNFGGHQLLPVQLLGLLLNMLWLLFGLTALAHQVHGMMQGEEPVTTRTALRFARQRLRSMVMLPVWVAGAFLLLMLVEYLLLGLSHVPGLGLVWLAVIAIPLILLNTVLAVAMVLVLFNLAARVAMTQASADEVRIKLWQLMRQRLPEMLVYNLGGVLVTVIVMALILSPVWIGGQMTLELMHVAAGDRLSLVLHPAGFWSGMAYMVGLMLCGLLVAAMASVPCIVITHVTVAIHCVLDMASDSEGHSATDADDADTGLPDSDVMAGEGEQHA